MESIIYAEMLMARSRLLMCYSLFRRAGTEVATQSGVTYFVGCFRDFYCLIFVLSRVASSILF